MNFNDLPRVGRRNRVHDVKRHTKRYTGIWVGLGTALVGAGTAVYSSQQQKKAANKALDAQRGIAADITYEPIDIERLKAEATQQAIQNATQSLALERQLQPNIAATREELSRQINADLKLGGQLPADVQNRVTQSARTIGARSGVGSGGTVPLTASLLGLSSIDLANQRRAAAGNLLGANPLPTAGLDPGAIASLEVANNAANNQFNLEKAGVASSLANSEAAARGAQIGGQVGTVASLGNLLGAGIGAYSDYKDSRAGVGSKMTYDDFIKKNRASSGTTGLGYTPVDTTFAF